MTFFLKKTTDILYCWKFWRDRKKKFFTNHTKKQVNDILETNFYRFFKFMKVITNGLSIIKLNEIKKKCIVASCDDFIYITERVAYDFVD